MRLIKASDYQHLSQLASSIVVSLVLEKPNAVLGLATGSTPLGCYAEIIKAHQEQKISFTKVKTVNLDEYVGLDPDNVQSYRYFMNENLFKYLDINLANTHVPDGLASNPNEHLKEYENLVRNLGVDLQILGLGHNGHIGFNEPASFFPRDTHLVKLDARTIEANKRFFTSAYEVPKSAYTQGIGTIMAAKKILLLVSGQDKKNILKEALYGPIKPEVPASILQLHPNLVVIASSDAFPEN